MGRLIGESDKDYLARLRPPPPDPEDYWGGPVADRLLVVDDDPDIARFIGVALSVRLPDGDQNPQGIFLEVDIVNDPTEALPLLEEHRYDLIITNRMMPYMDGFAFTRLLRRRPDTARTPILMSSAGSLALDQIGGFEAGCDDYQVRPFTPIELAARVRALLRRRAAPPEKPVGIGR